MLRLIITAFMLVLTGCAKDSNSGPVTPPDEQDILFTGSFKIGTTNSLEIMSWNIENFAKNYQTTVEYVAQIILEADVDIIAFQEIEDGSYFNNITTELNDLDSLNSWLGFRAKSGGSMELAYIVKTNEVSIFQSPFEIYQDDWYAFPREPYIFEFLYEGQFIVVINNHLKAMGDDESVERRRLASEMLQEYIDQHYPTQNLILVGDLNDEIQEMAEQNVFWNFIDDNQNYKFTDTDIALDGSHYQWSFPTWPSHLDHILITNELFDEFDNTGSIVRTLRVDDYLYGGWSEYESNISDHRPIILKLVF